MKSKRELFISFAINYLKEHKRARAREIVREYNKNCPRSCQVTVPEGAYYLCRTDIIKRSRRNHKEMAIYELATN